MGYSWGRMDQGVKRVRECGACCSTDSASQITVDMIMV
jgi:hypothetical protein